jgi:hypothetical protein
MPQTTPATTTTAATTTALTTTAGTHKQIIKFRVFMIKLSDQHV